MPSPSPQAPPLRVWAAAVLGFLGFLLVLLHREAGMRASRIQARVARIEAFAAVPGARVIAIGSSPLGSDLLDEARMGDLSRRAGGPGLAWLSLSVPNGTMEGFLPDLDRIIAARPELLLVDADMLYYRPTWSSPSSFPARAAEDFLMGLKANRRRAAIPHDPAPKAPGPDPDHGPEQFRAYGTYLEQREPRGVLALGDPILARLRQARSRGIQLVLLELPRFGPAEARIPARHRAQAGLTKAQLARECGARILVYPDRLPLTCFSDYSHLTASSAAGYSAWLAAELAGCAGRPWS